ncbi:hypothetical protein QQZ08_005498 [Neonectria magnoliae]|uniref:Acyltransferase 3 domain-containing protein n=1 Tax=Neonectria magnoliae TaxID=2732573 RepID=A0ABR1I3L7_9HYPO
MSSAKGHQPDLLPRAEEKGKDKDKDRVSASASASGAARNRDKIRCLDGLRGIACLIVFNYHFLWPWTPYIMLGHGALPPRAPEPYLNWPSLPIICLLHRGRPMVAIFFAISGYVLCRHIIRAIHERRLEAAYQGLASSVFRRVFRLYIPPSISMFLVAILAQVGVFRSEFSIYKGPDSSYINGTVTVAQLNRTCANGTFAASGAVSIAQYLGLQSSAFLDLGNTTNWNDTLTLCLNGTSQSFGPSLIYKVADEVEAELALLNATKTNDTLSQALETLAPAKLSPRSFFHKNEVKPPIPEVSNVTNSVNLTWVQLGGSWEEHPFIHDNMTYALKNFTRAYAEWANPFNFGHYHTRYDPHTFTIPMELRGSMFIYIFLLGTAALKAKWRLRFAGFLSAYSLTLGRWDMATFLGGAMLSEMDIRRADAGQVSSIVPPATAGWRGRRAGFNPSHRQAKLMRWIGIFVALYFLSYPDAGAEYTPGFVFLSSWVPKYYIPLSGWMFYQAMGALILLNCVLHSPFLRRILEGPTAQYLGKVSFSLYLVHGPVLHSLGFWIMPRLFERLGRVGGFVVGYIILLSVTMYLTRLWYRKVDMWSVTVGKRVEKALVQVD